MRFTYIIGYRHTPDRLENLKAVLKWLKNFDCEVIIVESDLESKIDLLSDFEFKHVLVKNNFPYNRSWCYNVGYKMAETEYLVFGDADLILEIDAINSSVNSLKEFDCVNPYNTVLDLNDWETSKFLEDGSIDFLRTINKPGRTGTNMCGGLVMFTKSGFEKIGGWNEEFWGWGAEDDFMTIKVEFFLKYSSLGYKCYHLNHVKSSIDRNLYFRNLNLLNQAKNTPKENFVPYMEKVINYIGETEKK
jgi:predicted glycosyltransferase involved in capsule biosynthesis